VPRQYFDSENVRKQINCAQMYIIYYSLIQAEHRKTVTSCSIAGNDLTFPVFEAELLVTSEELCQELSVIFLQLHWN